MDIYSSEIGQTHATRFLLSRAGLLSCSRSNRMRFKTSITIAHGEPPRNRRLMELDDDCLLMICEHLALGDQLRLMEVQEERFSSLILQLWSNRYAKLFDFRREQQLNPLKPDELAQILDHLGWRTRALINLPGTGEGCRKWLKRMRQSLTHLQILSFTKSNTLEHLKCASSWNCSQQRYQYPRNLEILKLPACMVTACVSQIFQLPRLRLLTAFLCQNSEHAHLDNDGKANCSGTGTLSACLQQIRGRNCRIVGLRMQCRLDDCLPVVDVEEVFRLQSFAWHSQLTVHYDVADSSVKWMPQRPQAVRSLLRFLATQAASLRELDFTRNAHATPTFLAQLDAHLKRAGGCPSIQLTNTDADVEADRGADADTAETNDLAFVELKLLHLPNEQTEAGTVEMTAMRD
ncbi:GD14725 [Drosophila simulans]|uniref:GD14725 n=1 Tax=Drosophila simulans TaxID=7240 RepID=B4QNZ3_DROSI|nr:GD14725 [Drosophila simulans]